MTKLVGVIHLPALPGSPNNVLAATDCVAVAVKDARALEAAGFDLVMLENFGDIPFFPERVPPITVAAMTACAAAVRAACPRLPLGINVLRNDAESALAIASVVGATCIRVNVHTGARVTDQGLVQGRAAETLRARKALGAGSVQVWADVDVKHSAALAPRSLAAETADAVLRGMAEAVLVTGEGTGKAAAYDKIAEVRAAASGRPVLVASGATVETLPHLAKVADGVIVGSALKENGTAGLPVDPARASAFVKAFRATFG